MISYNPTKPVISMHIPKCAGTSFSGVLRSWFGQGFFENYHNEKLDISPERHNLYSATVKKQVRPGLCVHGHFNNNRKNSTHDFYPEINQLITIIRHPFKVHVSTYFMVKRDQYNTELYYSGKPHPIIKNGWNLDDYLREVKKSYICNFLPPNFTLKNYQNIIDEQFIFIGISEYLQESVNLLANKLGFQAIDIATRKNVSEWNENIPGKALGEFILNNPLEMAIYNYAKNKLILMINEQRKS